LIHHPFAYSFAIIVTNKWMVFFCTVWLTSCSFLHVLEVFEHRYSWSKTSCNNV
jgi:hypothetical protein